MSFVFGLIFGCQLENKSRFLKEDIQFCYHSAQDNRNILSASFDPLELRWANGVNELCVYSDGEITVQGASTQTLNCFSTQGSGCEKLPAILFESPPLEVESDIFGQAETLIQMSQSLQIRIQDSDEEWATAYINQHGGRIELEGGHVLQLDSPDQILLNGKLVSFTQVKCLVMIDVAQPHTSLCLFSNSGVGYAHVEKWLHVRRAGNSGLDHRRAYTLNGKSLSYPVITQEMEH